jgi:phosphate transport system substrate-binding protein
VISSVKVLLAGVAAAVAVASAPVMAADISGAGATFPYPIYAKWADSYKKETGNGLNYQSIGSGGGIKQITARTVTFGASDVPLTAKELAAGGDLIQWPMVMGGIVPVVNLEGIKANELTLDGTTLAKIFLAEIKSWDDAAIKKLNPNVKLPSDAIVVVHRSDGSGTTFNFTNYLGKISPDWKSKVGSATSVEWPAGIGAKGNEGVANNVQQAKNSIGYVETAYAKQNKLTTTKMVNKDGKAVEANGETVQAASVNADWANSDGFYLIITDQAGANVWPISASTFILMPKKVPDAAAAGEALKFFAWAYANGDKAAEALDYVSMPANVKKLVESRWSQIVGPDGKPVWSQATGLGAH